MVLCSDEDRREIHTVEELVELVLENFEKGLSLGDLRMGNLLIDYADLRPHS